jgi:hypothetical protein
MRTWIALSLVLAALLALAALVATERLPPIAPDYAESLALMRAPTPSMGDADAFAALWTARHAIADQDIERVTADSVASWWAHARGAQRPSIGMLREHPSLLPPLRLRLLPCPATDGRCLQEVRGDAEGVRTRLQAWEPFRQQNRRLDRYDHVRNAFPPLLWAPTPPLMDLPRPELSRAALLHVDGDSAQALDEICRFAAIWRRLGTRTDSLIIRLVGTRYVALSAQLHAEILAETAPTLVVPERCRYALAPFEDSEFDLCPIMRQEFAAGIAILDAAQREEGEAAARNGPIRRVLLNRKHLQALTSAPLAWYCQDAHRQYVAGREPLPRGVPPRPRCSRMETLFNSMGCRLLPLSRVRHRDHYHRLLDIDALLRMFELAQWLRQQDDADAAFADRPADWRLPHHGVELDAEAGLLRMRPLAPDSGAEQTIRFRARACAPADPSCA